VGFPSRVRPHETVVCSALPRTHGPEPGRRLMTIVIKVIEDASVNSRV
jgi:hypothetical protein